LRSYRGTHSKVNYGQHILRQKGMNSLKMTPTTITSRSSTVNNVMQEVCHNVTLILNVAIIILKQGPAEVSFMLQH